MRGLIGPSWFSCPEGDAQGSEFYRAGLLGRVMEYILPPRQLEVTKTGTDNHSF
jgi:hypothetical protein